MIDLAFKNITKQKSRTILTLLGIIIGISAIVALGSLSEGLRQQISQNLELNAGKITVAQKGSSGFAVGFLGSELTQDNLDTIAGVSGVKEVVPQKYYIENIIPFKGPEWIAIGIEPEKIEYFKGPNILPEEGRDLEEGDTDVMVAGKNFAAQRNLEVGDFFTVKDTDLEIVGVLESSGVSNIDDNFIVPLETLNDITGDEFFPVAYAIPEDLREIEVVSSRIQDADEDFEVFSSTDIARQAGQIVDQVSFFTLGIGAVAALVGGLGIMNTMIMAVLERKREIGVMKAVGATKRVVLVQFLTEAFLIAAIGGIAGIILGMLGAAGLGLAFGGRGGVVTPGLAIGSFLFSIGLGICGGLYPAYKAAKQDPVEALRYE